MEGKVFLFAIEHHSCKSYGAIGTDFHAFLTSALKGRTRAPTTSRGPFHSLSRRSVAHHSRYESCRYLLTCSVWFRMFVFWATRNRHYHWVRDMIILQGCW